MELVQGLLLITSIHLLAAASPGPDFVLVSQQTLSQGEKAGLMCSLGIALGLSVHILYSAFGLAAIIVNSVGALWAIKIFGGCYLIYLGVKGIKAKPSLEFAQSSVPKDSYSWLKSIGTVFLCNALNPKAPVYFVSLFTLVLSPEMPLHQIAIYGVWMMCIQLAWFSTAVTLLTTAKLNLKFRRASTWIDRVLGSAMILLGIKLLTARLT